jgi:hypothetical protein
MGRGPPRVAKYFIIHVSRHGGDLTPVDWGDSNMV